MECVWLERYRAIYLEVPKVACTSIKTALAPLAGVRIEETGGDPHRARSQSAFVTDACGDLSVDFVGRYERLTDDFEHVARAIGLPPLELPRLQAARSAVAYAAFYTAETQRLVARR